MIKSDTGIKKAALQKEEQLYTYLIYLQALFYRNLINTILMTATVKFGREELCQNHIRFFSADEASRHNQYISVIVLTGQVRNFCIPTESSTNSLVLVQRHIDSVSTAADSDTGITFSRFHCKSQRMSIIRIVYACGRVSSEILVSPAFYFQPAANIFFQFKTGMVAC